MCKGSMPTCVSGKAGCKEKLRLSDQREGSLAFMEGMSGPRHVHPSESRLATGE